MQKETRIIKIMQKETKLEMKTVMGIRR